MPREDTSLSFDFLKPQRWLDDSAADFDAEVDPHVELLINQVEELSTLEDGWMGYNSDAPSTQAISGAVFFITKMLRPDIPQPDIFPCPNGNIQLEWSCFQLEVEIEIESKTQYHASFEDLNTGVSWEALFTYDLSEISKLLLELTARKTASDKGRVAVHG